MHVHLFSLDGDDCSMPLVESNRGGHRRGVTVKMAARRWSHTPSALNASLEQKRTGGQRKFEKRDTKYVVLYLVHEYTHSPLV